MQISTILLIQRHDVLCSKGLLAFGANVNLKNSYGLTPLDLAMMHKQDELIGLLRSVGGLSRLVAPPKQPIYPAGTEEFVVDLHICVTCK